MGVRSIISPSWGTDSPTHAMAAALHADLEAGSRAHGGWRRRRRQRSCSARSAPGADRPSHSTPRGARRNPSSPGPMRVPAKPGIAIRINSASFWCYEDSVAARNSSRQSRPIACYAPRRERLAPHGERLLAVAPLHGQAGQHGRGVLPAGARIRSPQLLELSIGPQIAVAIGLEVVRLPKPARSRWLRSAGSQLEAYQSRVASSGERARRVLGSAHRREPRRPGAARHSRSAGKTR